jgi:hypothetical protein
MVTFFLIRVKSNDPKRQTMSLLPEGIPEINQTFPGVYFSLKTIKKGLTS